MTPIHKQRLTADVEGDFVVFLIGMRINKLWKIHKWFPVVTAMPKMLAELAKDPGSGFLGATQALISPRMPVVIQYWRSFGHLERYARSKDAVHYPAWVKFNQRISSHGDVGIWHETYAVPAGAYECVYNNMPDFGLGKATKLVPAAGNRTTAAGRMGREEQGEGVPAGGAGS